MVCHNIRTVFVYSMQNVVYANLVRVLDVIGNRVQGTPHPVAIDYSTYTIIDQ